MKEYVSRRKAFSQRLDTNSVAILPSANLQFRNSDTEWPFRQSSDFYYLTGFREPNALCVFEKTEDGQVKFLLFNQTKDPTAEIWTGRRVGQQGACEEYGCDEAYPIEQADEKIPELFIDKKVVYFPIGNDEALDTKVNRWLKRTKTLARQKARSLGQKIKCVPDTLQDILPLIHELRLFKTPQEIDLMKTAAQISADAHRQLMQLCQPDMMEYQLEASFAHYCQQAGCRSMAYMSIVGGGNNACILHYTANEMPLKAGELVLIDAGGEYQYYAADITRTFPVNGKFTEPQRKIYELVLKSQEAGIKQVKPGNTFNQVQEVILEVLVEGLIELGLLSGTVEKLIQEKAYEKFYMHNSGHWLGLDVHDAGSYKKAGLWRAFEPNMVLTVEPGLYLSEDMTDIDEQWRGIGVRIEDDVLVTKTGHEILSKDVVKTVAEIEALMS